ncbi:MAG: sigma-70 family RNA polymerase sigma factor [Acidobacteriota bacterium]
MKISDRELVRKILNGERENFEILINKYKGPIVNFVYRMVMNMENALDISQEIFIKVFNSLHVYNPSYEFSTWLYKIATNLTIDHLRKSKVKPVSLDRDVFDEEKIGFDIPDDSMAPHKIWNEERIKESIIEAIDLLPQGLKELIVLRHISELPYSEIAEIKGLPLGTVKNRIFRAREMIRNYLEKKNE